MARSKLSRVTTLMVADTAFDYLRAGEHYNVTVTYQDGKPAKGHSIDVRRAYGDTGCGTYIQLWQYQRQVACGNLHAVAA